MVVELYSEPLRRHFIASRFSCAYVFSLLMTAYLVAAPFILSSRNGSIWLKEDTYREVPEVKFSYRAIIVAQAVGGARDNDNDNDDDNGTEEFGDHEIFYSTIGPANLLRADRGLRMARVRSREVDKNLDGKAERFEMTAELPLLRGERLYSLQAALLFDYRLNGPVRLDTEILAYASHSSGLPGTAFRTRGDLILRQTSPLKVWDKDTFHSPYFHEPLLDATVASHRAAYSNIGSIVDRYAGRNVGADYKERFGLWTRTGSSGNILSPGQEGGGVFNFTFVMDIPSQIVQYRPTKSDMFKEAWVRYLSMLVVCSFFFHRICKFVYFNEIVDTDMIVDSGRL